MVAGEKMGSCRAAVIENSPGISPFLESQKAWEKQYYRTRNLPGAQDRKQIHGIAKMGQYYSNVLDSQEIPNSSSHHFKGNEECEYPISGRADAR